MKLLRQVMGDAILLETPRFGDERGAVIVAYEINAAEQVGLPTDFVQDTHSISGPAGTIRGLHLQLPPHAQGKLIRVLRGSIVDVIVDLRPGSATHGQHASVCLDAESGHQLWVPAGFAHGFCTVEADTEVFYKVDAPYRPDAEWSLAWDDPTLAIEWPVRPGEAVLSGKDATGMSLAETIRAIEETQR